jgi:hypothetical protein
MKIVFNYEMVRGNELLFWTYIISMLLIMILTIIFVRKEQNGSK